MDRSEGSGWQSRMGEDLIAKTYHVYRSRQRDKKCPTEAVGESKSRFTRARRPLSLAIPALFPLASCTSSALHNLMFSLSFCPARKPPRATTVARANQNKQGYTPNTTANWGVVGDRTNRDKPQTARTENHRRQCLCFEALTHTYSYPLDRTLLRRSSVDQPVVFRLDRRL